MVVASDKTEPIYWAAGASIPALMVFGEAPQNHHYLTDIDRPIDKRSPLAAPLFTGLLGGWVPPSPTGYYRLYIIFIPLNPHRPASYYYLMQASPHDNVRISEHRGLALFSCIQMKILTTADKSNQPTGQYSVAMPAYINEAPPP